jgi:hypothetical protein
MDYSFQFTNTDQLWWLLAFAAAMAVFYCFFMPIERKEK